MGHSLGTPAPKRLPERSWGITAGSEMHARAGRVEGVAKTRGRLLLHYDWLSWLSLAEKTANEGRGRFALGTRGRSKLRRSGCGRCANLKAGEGTARHSLRVSPSVVPTR